MDISLTRVSTNINVIIEIKCYLKNKIVRKNYAIKRFYYPYFTRKYHLL